MIFLWEIGNIHYEGVQVRGGCGYDQTDVAADPILIYKKGNTPVILTEEVKYWI